MKNNFKKLENLRLESMPWYKEFLYVQAREFENSRKFKSAINNYKKIVEFGDKEGIVCIAKMYAVYGSALDPSDKMIPSTIPSTLLPWLKSLSSEYGEEVFKTAYLLVASNLLKPTDRSRYTVFLENSSHAAAKKYYKLLVEGEKIK